MDGGQVWNVPRGIVRGRSGVCARKWDDIILSHVRVIVGVDMCRQARERVTRDRGCDALRDDYGKVLAEPSPWNRPPRESRAMVIFAHDSPWWRQFIIITHIRGLAHSFRHSAAARRRPLWAADGPRAEPSSHTRRHSPCWY